MLGPYVNMVYVNMVGVFIVFFVGTFSPLLLKVSWITLLEKRRKENVANNRMLLICNVCHPKKGDWQYHDKGTLVIAKWYPGGEGDEGAPYYRNDDGQGMGEEFLEFLDEHKHGEYASEHYTKGAGQENPVRIEYESDGLPILPKEKRKKK